MAQSSVFAKSKVNSISFHGAINKKSAPLALERTGLASIAKMIPPSPCFKGEIAYR
jgi:hypothetical protein